MNKDENNFKANMQRWGQFPVVMVKHDLSDIQYGNLGSVPYNYFVTLFID